MNKEVNRGLMYRAILAGLIVLIIILKPNTLEEILPILLGLLSSGTASAFTTIRRN